MASDIVDHAQASNSVVKNYTVVVGAPKGAGTAAYGSKYTLSAGDTSDLGSGSVAKGATGGVNDAAPLGVLQTKLDSRFDNSGIL